MAYTQSDLDALDAKILASGTVKAAAFSDQSVTNRDIDEMLRLRAVIAADLASTSGAVRTRYAATRKGV